MIVLRLLRRLIRALARTASAHKKKLIALSILVLGYQIVRRRIKTQTVISIVMFFFKFWGKIMDLLPTPVYPNFRQIQPFQCFQQSDIPELANLIDLKQLLKKMKNKQEGAINQLKISVFSAVVLNLILYNSTTIYDIITLKYKADFADLGAAAVFQENMAMFKVEFYKNISNFRLFVVNQISDQVGKLSLTQTINIKRIQKIFQSLTDKIYSDLIDIREKVLSRKTSAENKKQYQVAQNYFKTTKQYIQPREPSKIGKALKVLFSPSILMYKFVSQIMKTPQQNLSPFRFSFNEYIYILPLKKFNNNRSWPTLQSKFLFDRVVDEMINFFYSINFNIVSYKHKEFKLRMFLNRVNIYFVKKVNCSEKRLIDLLAVFYKITEAEMNDSGRRREFYERQIFNALKETKYSPISSQISEYRLRNGILRQIYFKNEIDHLDKDMQAKLFNERDGLTIEPIAHNKRVYEEKDQIQQLMQIHNKADEQKTTTREQLQMMRELTD